MTKKKQTTAQAKGRMAVAAREQEKTRGRMIDAIYRSSYNSGKVYDRATKKWVNGDGAKTIVPPQYGNLRVSPRTAARTAATMSGKKLAKRGK